MSGRLIVPPEAVEAQRRASDPALSAWVAANAGSGKTYVLARRVVRLMLAGTPPGAILCLTFTKAAAATMANRVFELLGGWTLADDETLSRTLHELEGRVPTAARLVEARRLFAEALETPGGLKVQTIHAFCERVLHQFPFEANVASRFTVLDDRDQADLAERAKIAILLKAAAAPQEPLGEALTYLSIVAADQTLEDLIGEAMAAREAILAGIAAAGSVAAFTAGLAAVLGLAPGDTEEALQREVIGAAVIPPSEWHAVAATLRDLSKAAREKDVASLLERAALTGDAGLYREIFFTAAGEPRKSLVTKAVQTAEPALAAKFEAEQARLIALQEKLKAARLVAGTGALLTLSHAMAEEIAREKARRGALDFADLVAKTRDLFQRVDARWILYKLDQGIDHILVDEAQDTSPDQWELVRRLVEEFTAGEGARGRRRTLFVVGDEKQSIYSFQGADPAWFDRMKRHFERSFDQAGLDFATVPLTFSFRSTAAVLSAVDKVFDDAGTRKGLGPPGEPIRPHEAARAAAPGIVEVWPPTEVDSVPDPSPWTAPLDARPRHDPVALLAQRIAGHVRLWLDRGERLPDRQRPIRPGDILVLVRRRGALFDAVIRALKNAAIPVAGADRLVLGEHIAVMDLLALGDCLLTTDDDLSLAAVLKSPLVGLTEEELFALAAERPGSLWDAFQESGDTRAADLARWREEARVLPPAAFYGRVLSRDRRRRALLARLGSEAADAIDEFVAAALAFETAEIPTLHGFLAAMRVGTLEVKRDMEIGRDEVRVMTVHGAKGLEADVVFLADTMSKPGAHHDPKLFALEAAGGAHLVWSPSSKADPAPVAAARGRAREAQAEEYRRLLYVAMTRAADKLIVCGAKPRNTVTEVWYQMIESALGAEAAEEEADDGAGTVRRWRRGPAGMAAPAPVEAVRREAVDLPDWLIRDARPSAPFVLPLTPSGAGETEAVPLAPSPDLAERRRRALRRGTVVHRLLQSLPDVPDDLRAEATARYLDRQADMAADERAILGAATLNLIALPALAPLFGPGSRPEVPLAGRLGGRAVSGQIDRLVITPERIIIADYKTNDPVPAAVPEAYVTQLALYRRLLQAIHPDRPVEAWIVWTGAPDVVQVEDAALDEAFAKLGLG